MLKSIHNNFRELITELPTGNSGCLNIKILDKKFVLKRKNIKKGMVLMKVKISKILENFSAIIKILHHPTTIKINYEPVIHCGSVGKVQRFLY